jgi:hypothetical protein
VPPAIPIFIESSLGDLDINVHRLWMGFYSFKITTTVLSVLVESQAILAHTDPTHNPLQAKAN